MRFCLHAIYDVIPQYQQGSGQGYQEVGTELIAHDTALCACSGNGGVGDKGKIISEECASYHNGCHKSHADIGLGRDAGSYGYQCHNGAYRGADGQRDKAGSQKDTCQKQVFGKQPKSEIHSSVYCSHGFGGLGKRSGKDEYPNHQHDVGIGSPHGVLQDTVI